jgi:hypothetical protein
MKIIKLFLSINKTKKKRKGERKENLTKTKSNISYVFCFERWTKSEDDKLRKLKQEGNLKMKDIAKRFPGKSTRACENRWQILKTEHVSFLQILFFY